jgi:hypothetical protein
VWFAFAVLHDGEDQPAIHVGLSKQANLFQFPLDGEGGPRIRPAALSLRLVDRDT